MSLMGTGPVLTSGSKSTHFPHLNIRFHHTTSMYSILKVPGKGKGLIASADIPRGTRILEEQLIVAIPDGSLNNNRLKA